MNNIDFTTCDLLSNNVATCVDLWRDRMAEGYPERLVLENAAASISGFIGVIATSSDHTVGFAAGYVGTAAGVLSIPYAKTHGKFSLPPTELVGYIDVVCVREDHEGNGIATALVREIIRQFEHQDITLVTEIWHREGPDGRDVVEKFGFDRVLTDDDYWQMATRGLGKCPECNSTPCQCTGSLQVRG